MSSIKKYSETGISDVLSFFGIPTNTASQIYTDILNKRAHEALEILLAEIRQGNFENIDQDEAVSIIARYQRAAIEGAAKRNLRMMAKVIRGMAEKQDLTAPSFMKYANILASLTKDEILVLGIMSKSNWGIFIGDRNASEFKKHGIENYESVQQALMRTGLVLMNIHSDSEDVRESMALGTNMKRMQSHKVYTLTPLMTEIESYIRNFSESDLN